MYHTSTLFFYPYVKDIMWDGVLTGENKVYSIFDANSEYCGSMELQHPDDDTPEIGIDLLESKQNKGIAAKVVRLLAREAYEERNVEYFLLRISSRNKHSRHVAEKIGAILIDEEDTMFERFLNAIDMYGIEGNHFRLYRVPLLLNGENCVLPCLDSSAIHIKKLVELAQN